MMKNKVKKISKDYIKHTKNSGMFELNAYNTENKRQGETFHDAKQFCLIKKS